VLKNVAAERTFDQPTEDFGPSRPHALFATATGEIGIASPLRGSRPIFAERQLSELQRRSREVLSHKLIQHQAAGSLRRLGQMLLTNIRRIHGQRYDAIAAGGRADSAPLEIEELVPSSHRLLDAIVNQIALCDSTARESLALVEWGRRLTLQEPIKLYKLLPFVDRIGEEVRRIGELRMLIPLPGLPLEALIESQTGSTAAANLVSGITTARVLVWLFGNDRRQTARLSRLVLAALFQDVGRLSAVGELSATVLRRHSSDWIDRQHPTIGAALFGTVRGASVELPMLVAQHHEQLDGGGFPRALAGREILHDATILAATGRFAELCLAAPDANPEFLPASTASMAGKSSAASAAQTLLSEAEWGKWPLDFSRRLVEIVAETDGHVHREPPPDAGEQRPIEINSSMAQAAASTVDDHRLQRHDREDYLQGIHADPAFWHAETASRTVRSRFDNDR
jgi:hypothetical protein